jgi:hypothetical protein
MPRFASAPVSSLAQTPILRRSDVVVQVEIDPADPSMSHLIEHRELSTLAKLPGRPSGVRFEE